MSVFKVRYSYEMVSLGLNQRDFTLGIMSPHVQINYYKTWPTHDMEGVQGFKGDNPKLRIYRHLADEHLLYPV
jgi:hypothetical protein